MYFFVFVIVLVVPIILHYALGRNKVIEFNSIEAFFNEVKGKSINTVYDKYPNIRVGGKVYCANEPKKAYGRHYESRGFRILDYTNREIGYKHTIQLQTGEGNWLVEKYVNFSE